MTEIYPKDKHEIIRQQAELAKDLLILSLKNNYFVDYGIVFNISLPHIIIYDFNRVILNFDIDHYDILLQDYNEMDFTQFILIYGKDPFNFNQIDDYDFSCIKKGLVRFKSNQESK